LIAELGIQLRELELERKEDHKIVKLHPFEVASLANLIKAVSSYLANYLILFNLIKKVFLATNLPSFLSFLPYV
jgi:hypothetical protein